MSKFLTSRYLVAKMLEHADDYEWSWQGFGMFRLYLSKEVRLHVWAPETATPDVTTIHTHPWDFESKVIFGHMLDKRYKVVRGLHVGPFSGGMKPYIEQRIVCGPGGGCVTGQTRDVLLDGPFAKVFDAGESYSMRADELHESCPKPGTVTIIKRTFKEDTEHANVYHKVGTPWVSAEPRPATTDEVRHMTGVFFDALEEYGFARDLLSTPRGPAIVR